MTDRFSTDCAHAGEEQIPSLSTPSAMPIYQTSVYDFPDLEAVDGVWEGKDAGYIYGRFGLPNTTALENIVAKLERGEAALASASGMASIMVAFTTLTKAGDEILVAQDSYGGTLGLAGKEFGRFGIASRLMTDLRPSSIAGAIGPATRAVLVETISNPLWNLVDVRGLAEVCRAKGVTLVVDNTSATPCVVRPLEQGADVVLHSATKFLGGHHDMTAGVLVGTREFIARARESQIRLGPSLAPFDAWLAVRGIKTLALRMERSCANAAQVATFLAAHSAIARVYYPGIGAIISFDLRGDLQTAAGFVKRLKMIRFAPSFGGVTTTITHPAKTSHRSLTQAQRDEVGIGDALIRMSLGIEDAADIVAELDRALLG